MACSRVFMLLCMMAVSMVALLLGGAKANVTCGQVVNDLTPCLTYLEKGGTPATGCCNGIKSLYGMARTTSDRQSVCNCVKTAIGKVKYTSTNLGLASGLPAKCGLKSPYKISPSTNCKRYTKKHEIWISSYHIMFTNCTYVCTYLDVWVTGFFFYHFVAASSES